MSLFDIAVTIASSLHAIHLVAPVLLVTFRAEEIF